MKALGETTMEMRAEEAKVEAAGAVSEAGGTQRRPSTIKEVLEKAKTFVAAGWCQNMDAGLLRTGGIHCPAVDVDAKSWSVVGAVLRSCEGIEEGRYWLLYFGALRALRQVTKCLSLMVWNNRPERTHREILDVFDAAILIADRVLLRPRFSTAVDC